MKARSVNSLVATGAGIALALGGLAGIKYGERIDHQTGAYDLHKAAGIAGQGAERLSETFHNLQGISIEDPSGDVVAAVGSLNLVSTDLASAIGYSEQGKLLRANSGLPPQVANDGLVAIVDAKQEIDGIRGRLNNDPAGAQAELAALSAAYKNVRAAQGSLEAGGGNAAKRNYWYTFGSGASVLAIVTLLGNQIIGMAYQKRRRDDESVQASSPAPA